MKRKLGLGLAGTMLAILLSVFCGPYWIALEGVFVDWRSKFREPPRLSEKIKTFEVNGENFSAFKLIIAEIIKQGAKTISIYVSDDEFRKNLEWIKKIPKSKTVVSFDGRIINQLVSSIHDSDSLGKESGFNQVSSFVSFLSLREKTSLAKLLTFEKNYFTHSNAYVDVFGKFRKIPLWLEFEKRLIPAFAMNSWIRYLEIENPEIKLLSSRVELTDELSKISIPTDMNSMAMVEMPEEFEESIIKLKEDRNLFVETISKVDVKDKLVFVGFFTSEKRMEEKSLFRVQIGLANSFVKGSFLKEAHKSTVHSLSLILSVLVLILCQSGKGKMSGRGIAVLISSYLIINIVFFNAGLILPILSPILAMIFSVLADRRFNSEEAI